MDLRHAVRLPMTGPARKAARARKPVLSKAYQRIYAAVRRIPRGRVATYGDVARLAGMPRQPRLVGYALHAAPEEIRLPWHRVVNAQGRISLGRGVAGGELPQRFRLEREGVEFDPNGRIPLGSYRWDPTKRVRRSVTSPRDPAKRRPAAPKPRRQ